MIELFHRHILPAAYAVLPAPLNSTRATAQLLAIGLQESRFLKRYQDVGPARGFWQFEQGATGTRHGVAGVLGHPRTDAILRDACLALRYPRRVTAAELHEAIADNDVLAAVVARCLLWTSPTSLPRDGLDSDRAWDLYLECWRPGKPRPKDWPAHYATAWALVTPTASVTRQPRLRKDRL
jgi:hypothetical protein